MARKTVLLLLIAFAARADLKPETLQGFERYIKAIEPKLEQQNKSAEQFLWIDRQPDIKKRVRDGEIVTERMKPPDVPDGLIQHWVGAVFIPNATIDQVTRIDQDYARHKILYAPDVMDSKILKHQGNHFKVFLRFKKQKVITVVLDTIHEVDYIPLDKGRLFSRSTCDHVQEVKDPGEPDERQLPVGEGIGFMWAMNSYWRLAERDGGVYAECEAITLARDIPTGLGGVVGPIIRSLASDSLENTLTVKRRAVTAATKAGK